MKLAIMQPYFFPYIGYWQLIHAADCFVLSDDVQYIRHGWVNRNRILKPGGGWQYILVPLRKHGMAEPIKNIQAYPEKSWKDRIIAQLVHYTKKARYFDETRKLVKEALFGNNEQGIVAINFAIIKKLCTYMNIKREIIVSSRQEPKAFWTSIRSWWRNNTRNASCTSILSHSSSCSSIRLSISANCFSHCCFV
ncbi:MAG: WbqC family protein [Planctomycetes bacterium]|nr:WbqC family protein [Planctomycetota bacterium]